jgi:dipeptidyl aminopeptidase/acylaminoacyl peptidase
MLDRELRNPRRITRLNPELEETTMGSGRLIRWTTPDGRPLQGALLLPAGYQAGRRYPLVVKVYGGEMASEELNVFGLAGFAVDNLQLLATRGYAVLLPDAPLRDESLTEDLLAAVMSGVARTVELGIADPDRLGIMGHSFGGYGTLLILTRTGRFKAAVASASISDLISNYVRMDRDGDTFGIIWSEKGQGRMGGPPWPDPRRYLENSPILQLDRITTPLLLVHGSLDNVAQAEAAFVGLRRLGKEVVLARYEGEGHWQGTWGRPNVSDYWRRTIDWFDNHIGTAAGRAQRR